MLSKPWKTFVDYLLYLPVALLALFGFSMRVAGSSHVPKRGGFLIVANHQSAMDPVIVALTVGRPIRYLARKTLFRWPLFAWFIDAMGAAPIDLERGGLEGLKTGLAILRDGWGLVIFPEGTRTRDGSIGPLKPGFTVLVRKSGLPVLPVAIAGAFEAMPVRQPFPIPAPLFLPAGRSSLACVVGKPIPAEALARLKAEEISERLHAALVDLQDKAERLRRKG